MVYLDDLFDLLDLEQAIDAGYVRARAHGTRELRIYNYVDRCQFDGVWTPVTMQCRGLIATSDGRILARPWSKFFNYGDPTTGDLDPTAPVEVTDKVDGSLGILYPAESSVGAAGPGRWAIATRGAFESEQAIHATRTLWKRYPEFEPPTGVTVLVEIVYPANRVVVDYGDLDELVLLGGVDIATGRPIGPADIPGWPGPVTQTFTAATLAEALQLEPRPGAEGIVVRTIDTGAMVKIKQEDYIALHKLISGLNERVVWERLGAGETAVDICSQIPDEFHAWVRRAADDLLSAAADRKAAAVQEYLAILDELGAVWTRKDFAMRAGASERRALLFLLLDNRGIDTAIWKWLRPDGAPPIAAHGEDVA